MTARAGMANLITRLRGMTAAGTAEYTIADTPWFSDAQLQDVLDGGATLLEWQPLDWKPDTIPGDVEYHRAYIYVRDLEEATSGTTNWIVRDSTGLEVGTAQYTINYVTGEIRFPADTGGTALYLTGRSCDIYAAAADVWQQRCALMALNAYDVQSDAQRFSRSQAMANAVRMEAQMRQRAGQNIHRGALQMGRMVRTDLVATRW